MEQKPNRNVDDSWESSTRGDQAWKEATDRVASRNADARKAGRTEREAYERERDDARRTAAAKREAKLRKGSKP
jgi:hypothetical protein